MGAPRWRAHAFFVVALLLGVAIRVVVSYAYQPALIFPDTNGYVGTAYSLELHQLRPSGYSLMFLLPVLVPTGSMALVAWLQHLMGLGIAVALYAFLVRRGLPGWGATLAVLPVLFDPLQLVLEHYVLSDVLFEALLVGAALLLLWRRRPGWVAVPLAGLMIGASATVRGAGSFLIAVFVIALVCLRPHWTKVVAFVVAAVLPLGGYMVAYHEQHGIYALTKTGPRFLYARMAPVVRCDDPQLVIPDYEKILCPKEPVGQRPSTDFYMWGQGQGPAFHVKPPKGMTKMKVIKDFDKRMVRAEPFTYTGAVLKDLAGGFAPVRTYDVPGYPSSYWLFSDHYWSLDTFIARHVMSPKRLDEVSYGPTTAKFMETYRKVLWTPGPLMALFALLAAAAVLGVGRSRRSGDRVAVGLLAGAALMTVLTGAALSGFSWRYQLPQIPLLPVAAALGVAALVRGRAPGQPEPGEPLRPLDRVTGLLLAVPMPASLRRSLRSAAERGRVQTVLGLLAGVVAAALGTAVLIRSGWALLPFASLLGVTAGVVLAAMLLVSRVRSGPAEFLRVPAARDGGPDEPDEPTDDGRAVGAGARRD